ncbi:hypothetical protein AMECASPLE_015158 [Ameca splendens]|uniref:Uncharacterized protein n=1 Tax=Ameca splendens TaxID=208324 RepID=A0ABV0ZZM0_9TELE
MAVSAVTAVKVGFFFPGRETASPRGKVDQKLGSELPPASRHNIKPEWRGRCYSRNPRRVGHWSGFQSAWERL